MSTRRDKTDSADSFHGHLSTAAAVSVERQAKIDKTLRYRALYKVRGELRKAVANGNDVEVLADMLLRMSGGGKA